MSWSWKISGAVGALALALLSGCGGGSGACAGVRAVVPATARAGTTVTVHVAELWATCPDTGGGKPEPADTVTVGAAWVVDPMTIVVSGSSAVSDQATADVSLPIPSGGSGELLIKVKDQTVGYVAVSHR